MGVWPPWLFGVDMTDDEKRAWLQRENAFLRHCAYTVCACAAGLILAVVIFLAWVLL